MTCKSFSGMIPAFLQDALDDSQMLEFLDHYEKCADCREELEIQYLVSMAFDQMDQGKDVSLLEDLSGLIHRSHEQVRKRILMANLAYGLELIAVVLFVVSAIVYLA